MTKKLQFNILSSCLLLLTTTSSYSMHSDNNINTYKVKLLRFNSIVKPEMQQKLEAFEKDFISPRTLLTEKLATIKEEIHNPYLQKMLAREATQEVMTLHTGKTFKDAYLAETTEQRTSIQIQAKTKQIAIVKIYSEFTSQNQ